MRILVVADDPLARSGLANLLSEATELEVVAQVAMQDSVAAAYRAHQPDAVVWDLGWPSVDSGWRESLVGLVETGAPVVALISESSLMPEVRAAGARGLISRDAEPARVSAAVHAVSQGLVAVDPKFGRGWTANIDGSEEITTEELTDRELDVLRLLAEGLSNKTIAYRLEISEHTVKFHVNAILRKLGAQSRTEAVVRATRMGLILL